MLAGELQRELAGVQRRARGENVRDAGSGRTGEQLGIQALELRRMKIDADIDHAPIVSAQVLGQLALELRQ
jgi:hypothetical protein